MYYMTSFVIPSGCLVIISWVPFWLSLHAEPARVALGVTAILAMLTQANGVNAQLPPVKTLRSWVGSIGLKL